MASRRTALKKMLTGTAAFAIAPGLSFSSTETLLNSNILPRKGNIRHSVCRWCYGDVSLEDLCIFAKQIGISAIDLIGPKEWDILKKHGLDSSMCNGAELNLVDGWNNPKFHEKLIQNYTEMIPLVAKAGYKNLILFSGNRRGMDEETGLKNCVDGLKKIL
ncbi:MAG: hypothetical protein JNJ57_00775, partial [Saprospiraceae bacterium]|nr:hypothetical protein [Saprospiraceae bacterium]